MARWLKENLWFYVWAAIFSVVGTAIVYWIWPLR
jgi:hypothetical protein